MNKESDDTLIWLALALLLLACAFSTYLALA